MATTNKTTAVKRIKENITETEYKKLMNSVRGDDTIRENTRNNLQRTFCILYYTGLRLNELQELKIKDIQDLIKNKMIYTDISKTKTERKLFASDGFIKELKKIFDFTLEDSENRVITKGANKNKRTGINENTFTRIVNDYIRKVLGLRYTTHSFRQGLITEMGARGVNVKLIKDFIGHSDVKTTLRYTRATDEDIVNCIVR